MIKLTDLQLDKNDDSNNIYLKLKEFIDITVIKIIIKF